MMIAASSLTCRYYHSPQLALEGTVPLLYI
uniref:Uncharacterized protein n=1 Tax=Lepeophtheirus salmonis TaxID=72036 RepID=A0A0K2UJG3_LEPSM